MSHLKLHLPVANPDLSMIGFERTEEWWENCRSQTESDDLKKAAHMQQIDSFQDINAMACFKYCESVLKVLD